LAELLHVLYASAELPEALPASDLLVYELLQIFELLLLLLILLMLLVIMCFLHLPWRPEYSSTVILFRLL
jgi:hypothetical protein